MRLILTNKECGAHTKTVSKVIYSRLSTHHWEGKTLMEFIYGQLYIGKLAKR